MIPSFDYFYGFFWFIERRDVALTQRLNAVKHLSGGELGDGLGALTDGVLGELSGEHEPDGGLDLPGGEGGLLVVLGELAGLSGDALEDVVDEGVHDGHSLLGDSSVGVDLLEHLVDVGAVGLGPLLLLLGGAALLGALCGFLAGSLGHFTTKTGGEEGREIETWGEMTFLKSIRRTTCD